jgi:hypothetical protein
MMTLTGHVHNGAIVLDEEMSFPEGTRVSVTPVSPIPPEPAPQKRRVEFPLVRTGAAGSVHLTNERIAEILEEEDIAALQSTWNAPS